MNIVYPEQELFDGIATRLLDATIDSHWTDAGHVKPTVVGIYNDDYAEDQSDSLPYPRPAVFVEYDPYEQEDKGGAAKNDMKIKLHVVQDLYVTSRSDNPTKQTAYGNLLKYPTLIQQALHRHRIQNAVIDAYRQVAPDQSRKNLLVHVVEIRVLVSTDIVEV